MGSLGSGPFLLQILLLSSLGGNLALLKQKEELNHLDVEEPIYIISLTRAWFGEDIKLMISDINMSSTLERGTMQYEILTKCLG